MSLRSYTTVYTTLSLTRRDHARGKLVIQGRYVWCLSLLFVSFRFFSFLRQLVIRPMVVSDDNPQRILSAHPMRSLVTSGRASRYRGTSHRGLTFLQAGRRAINSLPPTAPRLPASDPQSNPSTRSGPPWLSSRVLAGKIQAEANEREAGGGRVRGRWR